LIGNPYPSAIDADKFINTNKDKIDGTLILGHKMDISAKIQDLMHLIFFRRLCCLQSGGTVPLGSDSGRTITPKGYIASGQGFL
jgi:hypothetical protein